MFDIYLKHPFTMLIAGPTGSGKTQWVKRLINQSEKICSPPPTRITYFYGEYQKAFDDLPVNLVKGLPENLIEKIDGANPEWIIIDDLMHETSNSKFVSELFTKGSHHRNISIILIVQNLFVKGNESRNISLNSQYMVLFKNPRNQVIGSTIARQIYPSKVAKFQSIFEDATRKPYSYLFIDMKPDTPIEVRLLTNVLNEGLMYAYVI